jgi:hypothetical protein
VPPAQAVQLDEPAAEDVPAAHARQTAGSEAPVAVLKVPAAQSVHAAFAASGA